ncbi:MAG TPA: DMT family transporter [bacterium]|jgi:drug/metabolite transporter (DMT)-like permease
MSKLTGWIVLLIVAAMWGSAYVCTRILLTYLDSFDLLVYRFLPSSVIAMIVALTVYRKKSIPLIKRFWWLFTLMAIFYLYGHQFFQILGQTVIPSAPAGLIIGTYPIFTVILASIFLHEKLTVPKISGMSLSFIATGYLMFKGASGEAVSQGISTHDWFKYGVIILISPIMAAILTILVKPYVSNGEKPGVQIDPAVLTMLYMAPCLFLLIPLLPSTIPLTGITTDLQFWLTLFVIIAFVTFAAYLGWLWVLKYFDAGMVAISTYIVPLFGIFYSWIILKEPIGIATILGGAGIIAGVIIASWKSK